MSPLDLNDLGLKEEGEIESVNALMSEGLPSDGFHFRLKSNHSFDLVVEDDGPEDLVVRAMIGEKELGHVYSQDSRGHRTLAVFSQAPETPDGLVAHIMFRLKVALEGKMPEFERCRGYDLILFYIREGYVPFDRDNDFHKLESDLIEYWISKPGITQAERQSIPLTTLRYDPEAAALYFQKLKLAIN